jgi:hypothetical protein
MVGEGKNNKIILGIIIHAGLLWASLALGYNSYKELMSEIEPLTRTVRDSIKATFPWAILIFSGMYFIFTRRKTGEIFLSWLYVPIFILYAVSINLFFFSKGRDIIIPLNLSILIFSIFLVSTLVLKRLMDISSNKYLPKAQDWLPPIVYRFLVNNLPRARAYIKEKPSAPFIIAFMVFLMICAFLLIFKAEKAAEQLANIAYFSLVIGVGIEVYRMIKYGEQDTGDNEQ